MAQAGVSKRQLGAELRRLREAQGLKLRDAAEHLRCSHSRVSRIESATGRTRIKDSELIQLSELYGVTDPSKVQALLDLSHDVNSTATWWDPFRGALPSGLEPLLGFETDAVTERAWEPVLVHGLLQTEEYAHEVVSSWPGNRPADVADLVALRVKRAELLTRERQPLHLWAVLDESVIHRPIGGADVMRRQIKRLLDLSELPNVTLQLMPLAKGAHPGVGGGFSVLEFDEAPPIAYVDSPAGNLYLDRNPNVRTLRHCLDLMCAHGLNPDDTTARLQAAL